MPIYRNENNFSIILRGLVVALFFLSLSPWTLAAESDGRYSELIKKISTLASKDVIAAAEKEEQRDPDKALVIYMVVCNRADDAVTDPERELASYAFFRTGYLHYEAGRYSKAMQSYLKGLRLCESTKNKRYAAGLYKDIGIIYNAYNDYEKGMYYLRKGEKMLGKHPDPYMEYKLRTSILFNCLSLNDREGAEEAYEKLGKLKYQRTDLTRFMDLYTRALIDMQHENYDAAAKGFMRSASFAKERNVGAVYECSAYEWLYKTYWRQGRNDSVYKYLNICNNLVDSCGIRYRFTVTLLDLARYHEERGDIALSQRYKAEYFTEMDSIFNRREFDMVKNNLSEYELDKVDSEIRGLQTKEKERATTIRKHVWILTAILAGTAVVIVLLVIIYRQKKRLNKSYRNLFEMYNRLESNHERSNVQYRECLGLLDKKEEELKRLRRESAEKDMTQSYAGEEGQERYNSSSLSEEMRHKLMRDINHVMDDTLEYCNDEFTLDKLSDLVGSNTRYVSQVINGYYGKNFNSFVNEYRIRLACLRLADDKTYGRHTINAIGQSVGFKSNTTFSAVFRKQTGMTPSVYQKMVRENAGQPS